MAVTCQEYSFFIFASCEPLKAAVDGASLMFLGNDEDDDYEIMNFLWFGLAIVLSIVWRRNYCCHVVSLS